MTFTEEWAALKAESAASTQLDGAGKGSEGADSGRRGGPASNLDISTSSLRRLSSKAHKLHRHADSALADLGDAHQDLSTSASGFASTTTLAAVLESWQKRLKDAQTACKRLDGALKAAADNHDGNDGDVASKFASANGGPPKSRIGEWAR